MSGAYYPVFPVFGKHVMLAFLASMLMLSVHLGRLDGTEWKVDASNGMIVATRAVPIANKFIGRAGAARHRTAACCLWHATLSATDGLQQSIATFDSTSLKLNAITKTAYRFNNISASPSGAGLLLSVPSGGNIILLSLQNLTQMNTVTLGLTPHVVKGPSD